MTKMVVRSSLGRIADQPAGKQPGRFLLRSPASFHVMPPSCRLLLPALAVLGLGAIISGCGSSASSGGAKAGPILAAGSASPGANTAVLAVASTQKFSMMPLNDMINAGVDWTLACSGNPVTGSTTNGACGTLSPAHTADGGSTTYTAPSIVPVGTGVTVTATVTSNPSQSTSVTLAVVTLPVTVAFGMPVPASLRVSTTQTLQAKVTNDPQGAGLIWTASCGSPACGSFNPTEGINTTYTAPSVVPAGGTVTISAVSLTDTTRSATATVAITLPPIPPSVGISLAPASLYVQTVGPARIGRFTAFVTADPAAAGVDWSVTCGSSSCGTITPHTASGGTASYLPPSAVPQGGTVSVTAAATSNPATTATGTAQVITTRPITASISPLPPATLPTGTQATLAATVLNDPNNAGLDWSASCGSVGACGSFDLTPAHTASGGSIVYTAPSSVPTGGTVVLSASPSSGSSSVPANPAVAFTTIVVQPPAITFSQAPPASLVAATPASVTATVANDVAPGGVTWSIAPCGSTVPGGCGWITPPQTASGAPAIYTAPPATAPGTMVSLVATSVADPTVSLTSAPVTIVPATALAISFIPALPAQVQLNGTVNLAAAIANDVSAAGVDWQVCPSGCGFFTVKPAVAALPATATTPFVPASPAVTATTVSGWSNALPIPYTAPPVLPTGGTVAVAASAHADTSKAISGTMVITSSGVGPALTGLVEAGSQPVSGAAVALYAAGTSGYASHAAQLGSATTDAHGSFTLAAGYACPSPSSQVYLVATGGSAAAANTANPNLALMTLLGSCNALSSAPVIINEVTSVASAYVATPFTSNNELTGNSSYQYLGSSSGNAAGLATAFSEVNNLVDIATGQARFLSAAGNAVVPYVLINTVADALNACAVTTGGVEGDGSPCGNLFAATNLVSVPALYNAIGPSDTLQAVFNLTQHPVTNYGYNMPVLDTSMLTPTSPFQPVLPAPPSDWSLTLHYLSGGGLAPSSTVGSFAVDATGNLWITDTHAGSVIEWNGAGAAVSPATGFAAGGGPLAIDTANNVWISGDGVLTELTNLGTPAPGTPFAGVPGGGADMAFDALGNLWIANGSGVSEYSSLGIALSPPGGYTFSNYSGIGAVGVDSADNVWIENQDSQNVGITFYSELTNPGGQLITEGRGAAGSALPEIAADRAGSLWAVIGQSGNGGELCNIPPYGGRGSVLLPTCSATGNAMGNLLLFNPQGLALDGAGTVWLASQGGGTTPAIPPSILPIAPSLSGTIAPNPLASSSLAAGTLRVAVDPSGNVWVLLADNTVTEYVGVATPVVTPVALGIATNRLAAKP